MIHLTLWQKSGLLKQAKTYTVATPETEVLPNLPAFTFNSRVILKEDQDIDQCLYSLVESIELNKMYAKVGAIFSSRIG